MDIFKRLDRKLDGLLYNPEEQGALIGSHRHQALELCLVKEGTFSCEIANRRVLARPGAILLIKSNLTHSYFEKSSDLNTLIAVYRPERLRDLGGFAETGFIPGKQALSQPCRLASVQGFRRIADLFTEVYAIQKSGCIPRINPALRFLLMEAWVEFNAGRSEDGGPAVLHPAVLKSIREVSQTGWPGSIEALAEKVGLSFSHLSRLFKAEAGISLTEFRARERVRRFLNLYDAHPELTALALALEAGFGSYTQFHRCFVKVTGRNPRRFLKGQS